VKGQWDWINVGSPEESWRSRPRQIERETEPEKRQYVVAAVLYLDVSDREQF
jgi:hypothetical protein